MTEQELQAVEQAIEQIQFTIAHLQRHALELEAEMQRLDQVKRALVAQLPVEKRIEHLF